MYCVNRQSKRDENIIMRCLYKREKLIKIYKYIYIECKRDKKWSNKFPLIQKRIRKGKNVNTQAVTNGDK